MNFAGDFHETACKTLCGGFDRIETFHEKHDQNIVCHQHTQNSIRISNQGSNREIKKNFLINSVSKKFIRKENQIQLIHVLNF